MRLHVAVDRYLDARAQRGGHRVGKPLMVAQYGIADVQRGVHAGLVVAQYAKVACKRAAGLVGAAHAKAQTVVLHAHAVRQRFQRAGHAKGAQHQQQLTKRVARDLGVGGVPRDAGGGQQHLAVRALCGLDLQMHVARKPIDLIAQGGVTRHGRGGDAGDDVAALAHLNALDIQPVGRVGRAQA